MSRRIRLPLAALEVFGQLLADHLGIESYTSFWLA